MADDRIRNIHSRMAAERRRVKGMIERDRAEARIEAIRKEADMELTEGITVNLSDTVVPPTPEWFKQGESQTVSVAGEKWTDRSSHQPIKTHRRIRTSQALRAFRRGRLNERQYAACVWYADMHEAAGLEGAIAGSNFDPRVMGGVGAGIMFTEKQVEAQTEIRNAKLMLDRRWIKFFEMVTCDDVSVRDAGRKARVYVNGFNTLALCADAVADYVELTRRGKELRKGD